MKFFGRFSSFFFGRRRFPTLGFIVVERDCLTLRRSFGRFANVATPNAGGTAISRQREVCVPRDNVEEVEFRQVPFWWNTYVIVRTDDGYIGRMFIPYRCAKLRHELVSAGWPVVDGPGLSLREFWLEPPQSVEVARLERARGYGGRRFKP